MGIAALLVSNIGWGVLPLYWHALSGMNAISVLAYRLIATLADWPLVSAPMAETETGASRAATQRNLDRLTGAGLIREVTGQGRYRLWTAKM